MLLIRMFEQRVAQLYAEGEIPGVAHLSSGQEGAAVGVCAALQRSDYITSTHRGHGHCLAKGAKPEGMFAELFGRTTGYCGGKGGSMHIADPESGNLGANGIVGGGIPIATGAAFSSKARKSGQAAACFFGDGALNQGVFLESLNLACIWKLPAVFVCENNQYGEYTAMREVTAGRPEARGEALGAPSQTVDGSDVVAVLAAAEEAVERARSGGGPSLLICETYRYEGHALGEEPAVYRRSEEVSEWRQKRDPILRLQERLREEFGASASELERLERETAEQIEQAVSRARQAPRPAVEEASRHVYAD